MTPDEYAAMLRLQEQIQREYVKFAPMVREAVKLERDLAMWHRQKEGTPTSGAERGIVKLTKSSSIDPQDTGLQPAVNPPCWASRTAVGLNLTIPRYVPLNIRHTFAMLGQANI